MTEHADRAGWIVTEDQTPLGFATAQLSWMVQIDEPVAELTALAVLPEKSNRRVGTRLLDHFESWAVDGGARRLKITSGSHRSDAHEFYRRRGYENSGVRFPRVVDV